MLATYKLLKVGRHSLLPSICHFIPRKVILVMHLPFNIRSLQLYKTRMKTEVVKNDSYFKNHINEPPVTTAVTNQQTL